MNEYAELYDDVGNDPISWVITAEALLQSADILKESHGENSGGSADAAQALHRMNMQQVFVMLRGMGVECLLKAAWCKNVKPLAAGGAYQKPVSANPHDLVLLERGLDEKIKTGLSLAERMVLARMSKQIVAGRYPIGTKVKQPLSLPPGGGSPFLMRWTDEDEQMFRSLVEKLAGLISMDS